MASAEVLALKKAMTEMQRMEREVRKMITDTVTVRHNENHD
jgi:hypothetical protein